MITFVRHTCRCGARDWQFILRHHELIVALLAVIGLSGCTGSLATNTTGTNGSTGTLVASSTSVDFGSVAVGNTASMTVTLTNQGTTAVKISQMTVTGQSFKTSTQSSLPVTVAAGGTFTLTVGFSPTAMGAATGQLTVTGAAAVMTTTAVSLSGAGVPVLNALNCTNNAITGAGTDDCTLTLNAQANSGGLSVNLSSSNTAVAVPSTVTVPEGATSAEFTASVVPVNALQGATLTASLGGVAQTFALQLGASAPALTLSASSLAFGTVPVNTPATQQLILSSMGSAAVTISAAALTGTGFTISGQSFPITINPGDTAALNVQFDPAAAGVATGQLTLTSNSVTGSSVTVSLSGTVVPVLNSLTCANASMTGAGTDSCTVTLNAAAASSGFVVNLSSASSLVVVPNSVTVAPGAMMATFTASASASTSAQVVMLTASAGSVSQAFNLNLDIQGASLSLSASTVTFGNVAINTQATQTLTLSSTGTNAVTINASTLSGAGFTATGATFPMTLNSNQSATLNLQFDPTVTGASTGQLTFTSNSVDGASKGVTLSGRGVPVLTGLSCATGSITGGATDSCTVTLNSAADSNGLLVQLGSSSAAVAVPSTVTVAAGAISASFSATASAVSVAQSVTLTASAGGISKATSLQLGASVITMQVSATKMTFGNVNVNNPATQSLTITSNGAAAVTISAATVAGIGFSVTGATFPLMLNPNQTATLTVQFDPSIAGLATGALTLTSNSSSGTTTLIRLSGTGVPVLSGLACTSSSITSAGTDNCTVSLSATAVSGTFFVNLASSNGAVTVPATVTVPAGTNSAGFAAIVSSVSTAQTVTLTASASGMTETFPLQLGAGGPTLSVNATTLAFGDVGLNTPATQSITLSSTGTAAVTVSGATVSGSGFSLSGASLPITLNPNQSAALSVQFNPTTAGAATGSLTIASNSSTGAATVISISGTGTSGSYQVNLSWDAPSSSSDPVAGYNVYRSPSGAGSYQQVNPSMLTGTTYTDSAVQVGQSYDYIVESVDASGVESAPSNTASAAIP
jgi:hypothetical protein